MLQYLGSIGAKNCSEQIVEVAWQLWSDCVGRHAGIQSKPKSQLTTLEYLKPIYLGIVVATDRNQINEKLSTVGFVDGVVLLLKHHNKGTCPTLGEFNECTARRFIA